MTDSMTLVPWHVQRALRWLWSTDTVLVYLMNATECPAPETMRKGHQPIAVRTAAVAEVRRNAHLPQRLRHALGDFDSGTLVHVASLREQIAAWGFSAETRQWLITETNTVLELPPSATCLMAFETIPEFRGQGVYKQLLRDILRSRFDAGLEWAFIWCDSDNRASRAAIEHVGFRLAARHERTRRIGIARTAMHPVQQDFAPT